MNGNAGTEALWPVGIVLGLDAYLAMVSLKALAAQLKGRRSFRQVSMPPDHRRDPSPTENASHQAGQSVFESSPENGAAGA